MTVRELQRFLVDAADGDLDRPVLVDHPTTLNADHVEGVRSGQDDGGRFVVIVVSAGG